MFWKKSEDKSQKELLRLMQILEVKVAKLDAHIELINIKLKKKVYKESPQEEKVSEEFKYNDGFDELRKLKKNGNPDY
tara:strand:+ start:327 stop:560 length:234 start_codon:yes stop_codon:yes gene_type:complete